MAYGAAATVNRAQSCMYPVPNTILIQFNRGYQYLKKLHDVPPNKKDRKKKFIRDIPHYKNIYKNKIVTKWTQISRFYQRRWSSFGQ